VRTASFLERTVFFNRRSGRNVFKPCCALVTTRYGFQMGSRRSERHIILFLGSIDSDAIGRNDNMGGRVCARGPPGRRRRSIARVCVTRYGAKIRSRTSRDPNRTIPKPISETINSRDGII